MAGFKRGKYVLTRLIRFDGTLLVCFSSIRHTLDRPITELDLSQSTTSSCREFNKIVKRYYPPGQLSSLVKFMTTTGNSTNPTSYYVPKYVIPIAEITTLIHHIDLDNPESAKSRTIEIKTLKQSYTLKASDSKETQRFKYLLETVMAQNNHSPFKGPSSLSHNIQATNLRRYIKRQEDYKRVLAAIIRHDPKMKESVETILIESQTIKIEQGVVFAPADPAINRKPTFGQRNRYSTRPDFESRFSSSLNSSIIDEQFDELENELDMH